MNLSEKIMDLVLWYADEVLMMEKRYAEFEKQSASGEFTANALLKLDHIYDEECGKLLVELTDKVNEIVEENEGCCCSCCCDDLK